jgi:hypothetical protein
MKMACRSSPAIWASVKRGFTNSPLHVEWYGLLRNASRLAVLAPREHAKTEVFSVNQTAWRSIYQPGTWTFLFAQTGDQAEKIKGRVDAAISEDRPDLVDGAKINTTKEIVYANGSRLTVAGAGKAVRGAHPDIIIGDDVLEELSTLTSYQRKKTANWWNGTVANMAHSGTVRKTGWIERTMPPTRVFLVGTPFHRQDLLMAMKDNPIYVYRRYAAEFRPGDLVDGLAVDVA